MKIYTSPITWPKGPYRWIEDRTLYISIPFTWNLPEVRAELLQCHIEWDTAIVGGPATQLMPDYLSGIDHVTIGRDMPGVLQMINPMATRSTVGCTRTCGFCGIGKGLVEPGGFRELEEWPDLPIYCDNNLLAASQAHFDRVIDRCKRWGWADFNQGLDARLLEQGHADRIAEIDDPMIRLALDHEGMKDEWENAFGKLRRAPRTGKKTGIPKDCIRSYALIGFNTPPLRGLGALPVDRRAWRQGTADVVPPSRRPGGK